ncbi:MAG: 3'-5' exonuclease, partial [Caldimonas sp.]
AMDEPSPALARARDLLWQWRGAAAQLPPHDLLDRIVHEGALRERTVAVVPAEQRALALDAIDAVLAQALLLDGGRYATPYGFVRALKRRAVKSAPPVRADAVRLLTVHGAKGLEADTVFVTDADPEPPSTETTTLLIDWPVKAERPLRCAFLYSESRCPSSLRELLGREVQAREREELNALYVAMTRARRRIVFSATEPFKSPARPSWWQRVEPFARPLAVPAPEAEAMPSHRVVVAWLKELPARSTPPAPPRPVRATVSETPRPPAATTTAQQALPFAEPEPEPAAAPAEPGADAWDSDAAPLGRAVHRVLEWSSQPGRSAGLDELAAAAAREFGVAARTVVTLAGAILGHPDAARFFAGPRILWSGNEVAVSAAGEVLRIDRLVQLDEGAGPVWWVLDYKLSRTPEALAPYREQLRRYREAVRAAQPGQTVRCAFIAGDGRVVEIA